VYLVSSWTQKCIQSLESKTRRSDITAPARLQTSSSDIQRVIIKLYTKSTQKSTDNSGNRGSHTDRFSCQRGRLSLLLRSFVSNCPTGGHEPPVCVPTTVNCMRQRFLHKPESITNKHRLQINNLCHCDSYSYLTTPKMTGTDNFLSSLSPLRMRHVVPTRLVQIPSKPSTHRRHVCSLTILCVQVRRIQ
jgi:hypothetical protein